ncbi:MAG: hypothetical protein JXD23_07900 [Spirochaetales bacterium]|nr:hypothetical protein [Spirochaetales bacterium]
MKERLQMGESNSAKPAGTAGVSPAVEKMQRQVTDTNEERQPKTAEGSEVTQPGKL